MNRLILLLSLALISYGASGQNLDPDYSYTISDTITNAESDTILLPVILSSPWSYNWTIASTQLSGTQSLAVKVQESSSKTSTDWLDLSGNITASGAAYTGRIVGALIYGYRQRLVITGSGTQSTVYTLRFVAKKVYR